MNLQLFRNLLALASLLPVTAFAELASGPVYTIRFNPPLHKPLHYAMKMNLAATHVTAGFTITVTNYAHGRYTLQVTIDSMKIPGVPPDKVSGFFAGTKITEVTDRNGKMISVKTAGKMGQLFKSGMFGTDTTFIGRPMRVGQEVIANVGTGANKVKCKVKLLGVETVKGLQIAKILTTAFPTPSIESSSGVFTVELRTAVLVAGKSSSVTLVAGRKNKVDVSVVKRPN